MHNVQTRRAFTLVELLVVMAALTVLAALTLPSLRTLLSDQKTSSAARIVQAHLDAARSRSIATGRYVAAILERNPEQSDAVTQLAIGQTFPPYEGDAEYVVGELQDSTGDGFYDTLFVPTRFAGLVGLISSGVFGPGDFIQLGDREQIFRIASINTTTRTITFENPSLTPSTPATMPVRTQAFNVPSSSPSATASPPILGANEVKFRIFRKPSKSFGQRSVLPRGTCIDMTVSGDGAAESFDPTDTANQLFIVFSPNGKVAYLMAASGLQFPADSIIHLLIGTTDQLTTSDPPEVADELDDATFNANINDTDSVWVSVNPYSGAIYSSSVQAGSEGSLLSVRLPVARQLANNAINVTKN